MQRVFAVVATLAASWLMVLATPLTATARV